MTDIRERHRRANNEASLSLLSYEYCFLRHVLRMQSAMPDCDRLVEIDKLARHCDTLRFVAGCGQMAMSDSGVETDVIIAPITVTLDSVERMVGAGSLRCLHIVQSHSAMLS
jgi:hypothetical protein